MIYSYNEGHDSYTWSNNLDDFKPPYLLVGKLDAELLKNKYLNLQKRSYGVISQTGEGHKQLFDYG